ncbi:MAG: TIGR02281 family clan AA aspartic protease [Rhizobiaceae bacterium]|nr:TIGR02281 family clan AA aspartic protease [Rhizobiaceae bacterium]
MRGNGLLLIVLAAIAIIVGVLMLNDDGMVGGMNEGDFAEGAYIGVWALACASSLVFVFRSNFSGALKAIAIYATLFIVLVGLYAYRGEFREVGDRIMAELVPGHAIAVSGSNGTQFQVMRQNDEHFHVAAEVNGRPIEFLVDTGASVVALDRTAAQAIGIDTENLAFTSRVMTANGVARSAPITLAHVRIGDIERENVDAAVMDQDGGGLSLLGMSFLGTLSSFDFRGERLTLTD